MFYRVATEGFSDSVESCRGDFGLVLGRHNDSYAASQAAFKGRTSSNALKRIEQTVIEYNGDSLKVGENHREIFWMLYCDLRVGVQAARCADVIEANKDNDLWAGRCVKADRMVKNNDSVKLTAAQLRRTAGLELSNSMIETSLRHGLDY
ncbi:hypothetical protein ACSMFS_22460 [Shewanella xiamenensis]|uniref:hypothetical protein n=1 Tax=Shewanella xiamenensis TaxID=332186 RepID=UPI003F19B375